MPEYDLNELLLTELLAMDVYHRDIEGGLKQLVDNLPQIDGAVPGITSDPQNPIGFFAKAELLLPLMPDNVHLFPVADH